MQDDPTALAAIVNDLPRPWLIGVDVDGTLAPIVATPDQSALVPDALLALDELAQRLGVMVAVVSGRPLTDLRHKFELPDHLMLLGSHGAEVGTEVDELDEHERRLLAEAHSMLDEIAAGLPGARVESKPVAAALHVRQSDPTAAAGVLGELRERLVSMPDYTVHNGHMVLEVAVRPASKTLAFGRLRRRLEPSTTVFIGDDNSDEHVFRSLGPDDVSIKVGPGDSDAAHRVPSPYEVVQFLLALARSGESIRRDER